MTGLPGGGATFIAVSIVVFTILGSVLEGIRAVVLFGPLLFPIAKAVGIHEVHYAMVIILAMGMGQADLGLHAGAADRVDHRRCVSMDFDWVLEITRRWLAFDLHFLMWIE